MGVSYARFAPSSDVYVFETGEHGGRWCCCDCWISPRSVTFDSRAEIVEHLLLHRQKGWKVPQEALDRLESEETAATDSA